MGVRELWHLHVPGVQRQAQRLGGPPQLCQVQALKPQEAYDIQGIVLCTPGMSDLYWHYHRSVTMDAWSSEQLKKMQLGGNDALNNFLKKYGVDKHTDIKDKYNSPAAEVRSALRF